jgi:hypothetical protein
MNIAGLLIGLALAILMAVVFHSLARSRKMDPEYAKRIAEGKVLMFPHDPLLMAILCDLAVIVVGILLVLRLFRPDTLAAFG